MLIAYPFVVYFGLKHFETYWLAAFLIVVVLIRFWLSRNMLSKLPWLKAATVFGVAALLLSALFKDELGILLYPAVVNLVMLGTFSYSLYKKPCIIESLARINEPDLDQYGVKYTENVTKVWCCFFFINTAISLYTAIYTNKEIWALYNGFISYLLIGFIFSVEWLVRRRVRSLKR